MLSLIGLFFLIDDDSKFQYAGYEKMTGNGGEDERDSMMGEKDLGKSKGTEIAKNCEVCPEMVMISPGMAILGSTHKISSGGLASGPAAQMEFKRTFAIGKFEITVKEFLTFLEETKHVPSRRCRRADGGRGAVRFRSPGYEQTPRHPAVCVSWHDANKYVQWLNTKSEKTYRLPTEAEWEFAARAGITAQSFMTGERLSPRVANFKPRTGLDKQGAVEVGTYSSNGNGLYDVHGNVWEMTRDCWSAYYQVAGGKKSKLDCSRRIVKGGSWASPMKQNGFAMRGAIPPNMSANNIGFRVAH